MAQAVEKAPTPHVARSRTATAAMPVSQPVLWLSTLVGVLALVAATAGLFWSQPGAPFPFVTLRGETVLMYGQGLYRLDSLFQAPIYRGQDAVTLLIGLPLLAGSAWAYRRGSLRGGLLLLGTLGYFLYVYASMALGAALNPLFFLYVALFSAGLFAFVLAFASVDLPAFARRFAPDMPRRGPAIFMYASGVVTLVIWALPILAVQLAGTAPPELGAGATMVTHALDLAIITPAAIVAGVLIWRRYPLGYLMALAMLVLEVMLAPMIGAQTAFQLAAGIELSPGQIIGPVAGFVTLALLACAVLIAILRKVKG